jgi:hypothetical protein
VKFMLLIHQEPGAFAAMTDDQRAAVMGQAEAIMTELEGTGEWLGGEGLAEPALARTVRVREGAVQVTDGPYAEAKEQLVGFCLIDVDGWDRALDVAARWPDSALWGLEVRPLL